MTRRVTVVALLTALIAALLAPHASAAPTYRNYVSLGDSFVSGPFIPLQRLDPLSCFKSTQNYPSVLARKLGIANFTDISCGGAQTKDMAGVQTGIPGQSVPQFSALKADTDLVTVSIGGNDIGFSDIILTCAGKSVSDPHGAPCKATYGDALAQRVDATSAKVASVGWLLADRAHLPRRRAVPRQRPEAAQRNARRPGPGRRCHFREPLRHQSRSRHVCGAVGQVGRGHHPDEHRVPRSPERQRHGCGG
jgi:lysophospholipase L1-like esterase